MRQSLYIIDGHAQIYAAYYAPMSSNLVSAGGEPTKVTFIVTNILLKLLRERKPDYIAVAMDAKGPTFRHHLFPAYKANRPPMPEDLPVQIERINEIIRAMNIPILHSPGYEADDLIGSLALQARGREVDVYICSKDKDLEQLIDERVFMYDPKSDLVTDLEGLQQSKGITPEQVPDVLALQGDTSDNIPGVPDVGPKTAVQWIGQYGSLENLIAHSDEIKGKRGENLRNNLDQLKLSRKLATIDREAPIGVVWEELAVGSPDIEALREIFERLNFRKLLVGLEGLGGKGPKEAVPERRSEKAGAGLSGQQSLFGDGDAEPSRGVDGDYALVTTEEGFKKFLSELKKQTSFALDTETTHINPVAAELVGLSFSWEPKRAYYIPVKGPLGQACLDKREVLETLRPILTDPQVRKVGQNIKYDFIVLEQAGVSLQGVAFDTMVASYLLDSTRAHHNMDSLALDFLNHETIKIEALIGKGKKQITFDQVDLATAAEYAAEDADVTWRLYEYFDKQLRERKLRELFETVEMPLVLVLARMESNGVALDTAWLKKLSGQYSNRLDELVQGIHKEAGMDFNVDSPKQLGEVLFEKLGLSSVKSTKGGTTGKKTYSTDQDVLEALQWQHPVPAMMLEYRKLAKLKNTYIDKLPAAICSKTHRVHASFNQTVTATGRLSSSNPNMQNIPIRSEQGQEIRRAFVPSQKGHVLLAADYSQIELRFMAHFSQDPGLLAAFVSKQDIHRFVASQVYGVAPEEVSASQRSHAKAVNFGIIYGQTAFGLSRSIGVSVGEAQKFIDGYFERYPRIQTYINSVIKQARQDGYVETILGRRRAIADLNSRNRNLSSLGERMAVNTVIQGSAADMIKLAMVHLHQRMMKEKLPLKMLLQVHDELVFELPEKEAQAMAEIVRHEMTCALELHVPVTVDIGWGANWLECK